MAELRKFPNWQTRKLSRMPQSDLGSKACSQSAKRTYTTQPCPGFQDFYTNRFQLATWLLERLSPVGWLRAIAALILTLVNLFLVVGVLWLVSQAVQFIAPSLWLLRLGLLLVSLLAIGASLISILLALWAAAFFRAGAASNVSGADTSMFFHTGEGAPSASMLYPDTARFRKEFLKANQDQMMEGVFVALFNQSHSRNRQEQLFLLAIVFCAISVLSFSSIGGLSLVGFIW